MFYGVEITELRGSTDADVWTYGLPGFLKQEQLFPSRGQDGRDGYAVSVWKCGSLQSQVVSRRKKEVLAPLRACNDLERLLSRPGSIRARLFVLVTNRGKKGLVASKCGSDDGSKMFLFLDVWDGIETADLLHARYCCETATWRAVLREKMRILWTLLPQGNVDSLEYQRRRIWEQALQSCALRWG